MDFRRLGKERVEAYQIWQTLTGQTKSNAWKNHPAVLMWKGYEDALLAYQDAMIKEWIRRGYRNNMLLRSSGTYENPPWLGDSRLHLSHQSNLVRKNPEYYGPIFNIHGELPYFWPIQNALG